MAGTGRRAQADGGNSRGRLRGEQTEGRALPHTRRKPSCRLGAGSSREQAQSSCLVDWVGPRTCVNVCVVCVCCERWLVVLTELGREDV